LLLREQRSKLNLLFKRLLALAGVETAAAKAIKNFDLRQTAKA